MGHSRIFKCPNLALALRFSVLQSHCPVGESEELSEVNWGPIHTESIHLHSEVWGHEEALKRYLGKQVPLHEGQGQDPHD